MSLTKPGLLLSLILIGLLSTCQQAFGSSGKDLIDVEQIRVIKGGGKYGLRHPSNVRVTSDHRILVMDGVSNRVATYTYEGKYLGSFGKGGTAEAELNYPLGMTIDTKDNIYIADSGNARIQIFSSEGKYLEQIELPWNKPQKRPDPTDVAIDNQRQLLYIVDNENHRVLIYSLTQKKFLRSIGSMSHQADGFRWPFSLYIDNEGVVYVVDVINTRVRTILPEQDFTMGSDIGKWGVEKGELFRPKGVAVDSKGQVFVADSYLGVIQIFDKTGKFQAVLGDGKGRVKRFTTPTRLYFDHSGLLYIVEMFANQISVYRTKP